MTRTTRPVKSIIALGVWTSFTERVYRKTGVARLSGFSRGAIVEPLSIVKAVTWRDVPERGEGDPRDRVPEDVAGWRCD